MAALAKASMKGPEQHAMPSIADWLPAATVGLSFTVLGLLKVYGLSRGTVGGIDKCASDRVCGTCPSWTRGVNLGFICFLLAVGLSNLAYLAWVFLG